MAKMIKDRLLVEFVSFSINNNGSFDKVFNPVRSTLHVQRQIPIGPSDHPMVEVLLKKERFKTNSETLFAPHRIGIDGGIMYNRTLQRGLLIARKTPCF